MRHNALYRADTARSQPDWVRCITACSDRKVGHWSGLDADGLESMPETDGSFLVIDDGLTCLFAGARRASSLPWGDGWALVGDGGWHRDAVLGQGISGAFRDSVFLPDAVDCALWGGQPVSAAPAGYEQRRNAGAVPSQPRGARRVPRCGGAVLSPCRSPYEMPERRSTRQPPSAAFQPAGGGAALSMAASSENTAKWSGRSPSSSSPTWLAPRKCGREAARKTPRRFAASTTVLSPCHRDQWRAGREEPRRRGHGQLQRSLRCPQRRGRDPAGLGPS